ncbi:MAG: ATP-binding cassette domain-containing protein [Clostridia bacterium]|nr:ATP-binding cassette domain-containing protein [Clostridia bacterium]
MEEIISLEEARKNYRNKSLDAGDGFLVLKNINKIYANKVQAVYDFNMKVDRNEFIVLVGPSGCGKSTTLRMIAGLEEITSGYLYIDGIMANYLASKDRDIAMVFQNYALYPNMTVFENIAFSLETKKTEDIKKDKDGNVVTDEKGNPVKYLRHYTKEEIKKKVFDAAEILDLGQYLDRKPKELSGGQMQRVALGRAIVRQAKLFLMDEPLSNLDAKLRVQMRSEIVKLHKSVHATTVYVTHDQTEAMTMADRIVIMNKGFVQQIGSPKEVYNNPANVFVAMFIGNPPTNVFEANTNGTAILNGEEKVTLPEEFEFLYEKFIKERKNYFENLKQDSDLTEEKSLSATAKELAGKVKTLSKEDIIVFSDKLISLSEKKRLFDFAESDKESLIKVFDGGDKRTIKRLLVKISLDLDDMPFIIKGILDGERSSMNASFAKKDDTAQVKSSKKVKLTAEGVYETSLKEIDEYIDFYSAEENSHSSLLIGIRPEDVHLYDEFTGDKSEAFTATVDFAELLGSEYCVHANAFGSRIVFKLDNKHTVNVGDVVKLCFNMDSVKLFDKKSGKAIRTVL